jgi:ribonuclease HI
MTQAVRLFVETAFHPAFRYGGWGIVREIGGAVSGLAGGERNITHARVDLMALIAAMDGMSVGTALTIQSASPGVIAAARLLATPPAPGSEDAPSEDLDLWARALKAASGRALTVKPVRREANTPAAFCFAWAEVGQDKAKTSAPGRFSAAIPKPNLAKLALTS